MQSIEIPVGKDFSFGECLWFLDRGLDDCLHRIRNGRIRKLLLVDSRPVLFELAESSNGMTATLLSGDTDAEVLTEVGQYVADWMDLTTDLTPFYHLLGKEPGLAYMQPRYFGLKLIGIPDVFEALVWSITGQQINLHFALRLKRRLVELWGTAYLWGSDKYYAFPSPQALVGVDPEQLKSLQFSGRKAEYILGLARAFAAGHVSKKHLEALPGFEARQKVLCDLRGVGSWTANYVLMKSLREPAAVPHGDAGLNAALRKHGYRPDDPGEVKALFDRFNGWEAYLVLYLWRSLSLRPGE